ncbi:hypothetical protein NM688_g6531 [Phlebia brevispora]|uniref:Uncharacterized protein n=1 Tax=Phlebia brevispora TaxID=194682 RepID=A0ACC1SFE3_9APHY|nr:hypothetical protein NM688_g6531 [Phlebia brevispora]
MSNVRCSRTDTYRAPIISCLLEQHAGLRDPPRPQPFKHVGVPLVRIRSAAGRKHCSVLMQPTFVYASNFWHTPRRSRLGASILTRLLPYQAGRISPREVGLERSGYNCVNRSALPRYIGPGSALLASTTHKLVQPAIHEPQTTHLKTFTMMIWPAYINQSFLQVDPSSITAFMADSAAVQQLDKKRERYRAQLLVALQEEEDPLALYEQFVKWTIDNYPDRLIPRSGLLELLEEATRQFKDDAAYRGDLRYLKIWSLYASYVEDPTVIYAFLVSNEIGTIYAQVYEEYAAALERKGRRAEAEKLYLHGIKRRARPVERLKKRYTEFQARASNPLAPAQSSNAIWQDAAPETQSLRRNPLKNYPQGKAKGATAEAPIAEASTSEAQHPSTSEGNPPPSKSRSKTAHDRYAPMLAPPAPGKRPEKLRFNLSLLFTEDRIEYSVQEARARSMGLLGKKWAPLPVTSSVHVDFNDDGHKDPKHTMRKGLAYSGGEPTVTLATKEALADVFGMYNSPEKSMRFGAVAGSKYAPVRRIEPVTPIALHPISRTLSNENDGVAFRPLADENANFQVFRDEELPAKFQIFRDEELPAKPTSHTPEPNRKVLSAKTPVEIPAAPTLSSENAPVLSRTSRASSNPPPRPSETEKPVFSAVFTPAASAVAPSSKRAVFSEPSQDEAKPVFQRQTSTKFTPFRDPNPPPVFSLPSTSQNRLAPSSQKAAFKPYVDETAPEPPKPVFSSSRPPLQASTSKPSIEDIPPQIQLAEPVEEELYDSSESSYVDDADAQQLVQMPIDDVGYVEEDSMFDDEVESYQVPLGGRLGQFNVMTPITERTFEFTTSTRASGTPGDGFGTRPFMHADALQSAEQLAAELRADVDIPPEMEEFSEDEPVDEQVQQVEERTGTLSLSDALMAASSFNPPNPCNPFDPSIVTTLLSFVPAEPAFFDLRADESNRLDALQKFAKKMGRKSSGSRRTSHDDETMQLELLEHRYSVTLKLGEGGFGAVFEAVDEDKRGDRDPDEDDFEDEDEIPKVAIKVVKPRTIWEFHVLRRIHQKLTDDRLKQSIIFPEALFAYRDESFLVLELCKQGTLLEIVNNAGKAGIDRAGSCSLDELLVMFFAIELMRLIEGMHRSGFIHGDMKIDNCLLRLEEVDPPSAWSSIYQPSGEGGWSKKGIKLIDFGRTIDTQLFPADQAFVGDWPTDVRDCFEMREGRPWTYQTDYFGLAGIIYCMLYGQYVDASSIVPAAPSPDGHTRYKVASSFKRYWQVDLWTRLFDLLLNPTPVHRDGQLPLCDELKDLRHEMEAWLQANCNRSSNTLKGLLKKVSLFVLGGKDGR